MALLAFAGEVVTSFVLNLASDGVNPGLLKKLSTGGALRNHHLEKAVETAYLRAFEGLVADCLKLEGEVAFTGHERVWLETKRNELRAQIKQVDGAERITPPLSSLDEVTALVKPAGDEAAALKHEVATKLVARAMDAEAPPRFQTYLKDQLYDLVALHFCDTLKHDSVVNNIFQGQVTSCILALERSTNAMVREILARLPRLAPEVLPVPHVAAIPHPLNPNFTGREELLAEVRRQLDARGRTVLHGIGGVGKTQLAVQYAHRNAGAYGAVLWIPAERDLPSAFLTLAEQLGLPAQDATKATLAVKGWLAKTENWLLVFDNATGPAEVRPFVPDAGRGHVLFTSRHPHWLALDIEVPPVPLLDDEAAAAFLQHRTRRQEPGPALDLARELGGLPLALEQAGAYVEQMQMPIAKYLDLYRQHRQRLLERGGAPVDYNRQTVGTTWEISFARLRPAAAALLNLCAYLAPDAIPEALVLEHPDQVPEVLGTALCDPLERGELVGELAAYSLVARDGERFSVHRLVQQVVRERLGAEERCTWAEAAVDVVGKAFPADVYQDPTAWPPAAVLAPHALAACDEAGHLGLTLSWASWLYNEVARLRQRQGAFVESERIYRCALAIHEQRCDKRNEAACRHNLGGLLRYIGQLDKARTELDRALALMREVLGPDHAHTAMALTTLANVLHAQGKLEAAWESHAEALRILRRAKGEKSPEVAVALNNLGTVLFELDDLVCARQHFEKALAIDLEVLTEKHPATPCLQRRAPSPKFSDSPSSSLTPPKPPVRADQSARSGNAACPSGPTAFSCVRPAAGTHRRFCTESGGSSCRFSTCAPN